MNPGTGTIRTLLVALAALTALAAGAQDEPTADDATPDAGSRENLPPETRVQRRQEAGQTITEYSRGGEVFLLTVKPRNGPTQYWSDPDGNGQFQESTGSAFDEDLNLPKWKLGDW